MEYKHLLIEVTEQIAIVKINRPEKLNALNAALISELKSFFIDAKSDDKISAIILTGNSSKAFVAGADITEINALDGISAKVFSEEGQNVFNLIESLRKPVIAAVNGFALGGGCELALACHIRIASDNAKFGQPEINLGVIPGYGGTQRLTKLINGGRAAYYILTGDMIDADEALRLGIVSAIFPQSKLLTEVINLAKKIASKPGIAAGYALDAIKFAENKPLEAGLAYEASLFSLCCNTHDFKEGTAAFTEKRKGNFINR